MTSDFALCGTCWRGTPFVTGLVCDSCGTPVPGEPGEEGAICEECSAVAPPWQRGRAAMLYRDNARSMILGLKHGDRMDMARPAGQWLRRAGREILRPDMLVVPVPLHWWRLLRRRYNQAALLSGALAKVADLDHCPDAVIRLRSTGSQEGRDRATRFARLEGAFALHPRRGKRVAGRHMLVVDDVMTSGATFAGVTRALLSGGAASVSVLALARVAKDA